MKPADYFILFQVGDDDVLLPVLFDLLGRASVF